MFNAHDSVIGKTFNLEVKKVTFIFISEAFQLFGIQEMFSLFLQGYEKDKIWKFLFLEKQRTTELQDPNEPQRSLMNGDIEVTPNNNAIFGQYFGFILNLHQDISQ